MKITTDLQQPYPQPDNTTGGCGGSIKACRYTSPGYYRIQVDAVLSPRDPGEAETAHCLIVQQFASLDLLALVSILRSIAQPRPLDLGNPCSYITNIDTPYGGTANDPAPRNWVTHP